MNKLRRINSLLGHLKKENFREVKSTVTADVFLLLMGLVPQVSIVTVFLKVSGLCTISMASSQNPKVFTMEKNVSTR